MSLRTEVYGLLDKARRLCSEVPDAQQIAQTLTELRGRLDAPLRVAVVGEIKAGKSTFMNALMKANIVYTGTEETTYTVCWFRYGDTPSLKVCFRDGSEQKAPFEDLKKWSVRTYEKENPRIHDVQYLMVFYPAEVLKTMEFIDTPGLNSVYGTDAQNTMDFLSLRGSEETLKEAGKADAVIFAFNRDFSDKSKKTLMQFHNCEKSNASPINSIGIFTKLDCDGSWDIDAPASPVELAEKRIEKVVNNPQVRQLLFTILPVCAKPSEGYRQLDREDWKALRHLAGKHREELCDILYDAQEFKTSKDEDFLEYGSVDSRKKLMAKLDRYGILAITDGLRTGKEPEQLEAVLQDVCGIDQVRQLINKHFGNRTFLIKTQYTFSQLHVMIHQIQRNPKSSQACRNVAEFLADEIDRLMSSVQALKELTVLQMYYNGQLDCMTEEEKLDLLRVTREFGRLPEDRLNARQDSSISDLSVLAKEQAALWNGKANCGWLQSGEYTDAAAVIARSYELMHYHLSALIEE